MKETFVFLALLAALTAAKYFIRAVIEREKELIREGKLPPPRRKQS